LEEDFPSPSNEEIMERRNERRYRMLLTHEYHPSLVLPLWSPTHVELGDVGYLSKPDGKFIRLFNCFDSPGSLQPGGNGIPSLLRTKVQRSSKTQEKRTMVQVGVELAQDLAHNLFSSISTNTRDRPPSDNVARRYSYPLHKDHRAAFLCAETTTYDYFDVLDELKMWFKAQVDRIMQTYGSLHRIEKEDLLLDEFLLPLPSTYLRAFRPIFALFLQWSGRSTHLNGRFS
jgi:hypothetical protein